MANNNIPPLTKGRIQVGLFSGKDETLKIKERGSITSPLSPPWQGGEELVFSSMGD